MKSGHYTVLIKINNEWFLFNDFQVIRVTEQLVMQHSFQSDDKCASMVFYIKHENLEDVGPSTKEIVANCFTDFVYGLYKIQNLDFNKNHSNVVYDDYQNKLERIQYFVDMGFPREQIIHLIETMPNADNATILNLLMPEKKKKKKKNN